MKKTLAIMALAASFATSFGVSALDLVSYREDGEAGTYDSHTFTPSASGEYVFYYNPDPATITGEAKGGPFLANMQSETVQRVGYLPGTSNIPSNTMYAHFMTSNKRFYIMQSYDPLPDMPAIDGYSHAQYLYDSVDDEYTPIGVDFNGQHQTTTGSQVSEDGKFVFFMSNQPIMAEYPALYDKELYMLEVATGEYTLISKHLDGSPFDRSPSTMGGRSRFVTGDGRYAVFTSTEENVLPDQGVSSIASNIFLYDRETDSLSVQNKSASGDVSNAEFSQSTISINGQYIAVISNDATLSDDRPENVRTSFGLLRLDRSDQSWTYLSVTNNGETSGNYSALTPSISADGKYIAFLSYTTDYTDIDSKRVQQAYVVNAETRDIAMASVSDVTGLAATKNVLSTNISDNGEYVFFSTLDNQMIIGGTDFNERQVYRWKNTLGNDYEEPVLCEI